MPGHNYHRRGRHGGRRRGHRSPNRSGSPPRRNRVGATPGWGAQPTWSVQPGFGHTSTSILAMLRDRIHSRYPVVYGRGNIRIHTYGGEDVNNDGGQAGTQDGSKPDPAKVLTVKNVDLKITANGKAHHTSKYDISSPFKANPKLVVRRGQPFNIDVDFSKPYDEKTDDLRIVFEAGDNPSTSKGTYVEFILSHEDKPREWGAKIDSQEGTSLTITVFTPPTCYVGTWDLKIDVVKKENTEVDVYSYVHKSPIYIIFNPWCKDDAVYMADEKLLNEYILNETGKIYSGSKTKITAKPWNFGQFESVVLDAALYLLDVSELNWAVRGNPIPVIRKLSAMVNSSDDGGILTGNWSGDYTGGTSPLSWTGSVAILEEYWKTKRPVQFGQCWVFSGVCTTVCRALGIPARSVTNFASAHDTDGSITIDAHFKPDGEVDDSLNYDSIWNFHVWNEAWMSRPDLPTGYGGWQAFDATPQETSDDVYCCGPVSVLAIQQGEVNLPYDGPFVFAEVNADRLYWVPDALGKLECAYFDKKVVGKFISTKAPNSDEREDLTLNYKYPDDSPEERVAVLKANQVGSNRKDIYQKKASDVKFIVEQDTENTWVGGNFEVSFRMKNRSTENRHVSGRVVVSSMYYTGVAADKLKSDPFEVVLKPGEEQVHKTVVTQDEYDGKLKDCCMMDVSVWAHVDETNQYFTKKDDFRLRKPHLTIKAPKEGTADKEFKADVSFTNPLNTTLTNCSVTVDGLATSVKFPQGNVSAKGTFTATIPITPKKTGQIELIVIFNSTQLEDINASVPILIRSA